MTINERVKEVRKTYAMTLEQFGSCVGISRGAVSNIELGKRTVTEQMIKSICREFNINEEWLRNGTGSMKLEIDLDIEYGRICADLGINDDRAKKIIMNYARFTPEDKQLFWNYVDALMKE